MRTTRYEHSTYVASPRGFAEGLVTTTAVHHQSAHQTDPDDPRNLPALAVWFLTIVYIWFFAMCAAGCGLVTVFFIYANWLLAIFPGLLTVGFLVMTIIGINSVLVGLVHLFKPNPNPETHFR